MEPRFAALAALMTLSACGHTDDAGVKDDPRAESERSGLALAGQRGKEIAVIPFDGSCRYFESGYSEPLMVSFGGGGRMIAWHPSSSWEGKDVIVTSIHGETVAQFSAPRGFFLGALNENARRLSFRGAAATDQTAGLRWTNLDMTAG